MKTKTKLFYQTREYLRKFDPNVSPRLLGELTEAVIALGIAFQNRQGDVKLCREDRNEKAS